MADPNLPVVVEEDDDDGDPDPGLNPVAAPQVSRMKFSLPQFTGEGTKEQTAEHLEIFIADIESYFTSIGETNDAGMLAGLRQAFKRDSPAQRWWATVCRSTVKQANTWADAVALMKTRFGQEKTAMQLAALRDTLTQKASEDVRTFADRVIFVQQEIDDKRRATNVPNVDNARRNRCVDQFSDMDSRMLFLCGVRPALRRILQQNPDAPATFDDMVLRAEAAEASEAEGASGKATAAAAKALIMAISCGQEDVSKEMAAINDSISAMGGASGSRGGNRGGRGGNRGARGGRGGSGRGGGRGGGASGGGGGDNARPSWLRFDQLPPDTCYTCGYKGHISPNCSVQPHRFKWARLIKELGLRPPQQGGQAPIGQQQQQQQQQPAAPPPPPASAPGQPVVAQPGTGAFYVPYQAATPVTPAPAPAPAAPQAAGPPPGTFNIGGNGGGGNGGGGYAGGGGPFGDFY